MNKKLAVLMMVSTCVFGSSVIAENKSGKGGDDFRKAAEGYEAKAKLHQKKGDTEIATYYRKMAQIKRKNAKLADDGKWDSISWDEYHKLESKISKLRNPNKKGKHSKKK